MHPDRPTTADERLVFPLEDLPAAPAQTGRAWLVLVVDDDPDVYAATALALRNVEILGRPLHILYAASAAEAFELLQSEPEVAVILLDVVMESERAGLDLVARIRGELGLAKPRIILRTGQPGYAPELRAIRDYDINDYRIKSELTRTRLFTLLTAALRGYQNLDAVEASRRDLEYLLASQTELLAANTLPAFSLGVLERLAQLFGVANAGLFCGHGRRGGEHEPRVLAATGSYAHWTWQRLDALGQHPEIRLVMEAFASRRTLHDPLGIAMRLPSRTSSDSVVFLAAAEIAQLRDPRVFEMFVQNTAMATEAVRLVERLREAAYVDGLTQLCNRAALTEAIEAALRSPGGDPLRLLLVDIDQFSEINETFGDPIGDALLREVAQRLEAQAGTLVRVARLANDTFAVLGPEALLVPADWLRAFDATFEIEGLHLSLSASIGGVDLDPSSPGGGEAIKRGYSALKRAKHDGHHAVSFYSHEVATEIKERTRLLHGLRAAFDQQRLFLVYQPLVEAASGRTVGFEALMRWRGEDGLLIPPDRFIPVAEQSGLIKGLGHWGLRVAVHRAADLRARGHQLRMAVNVSVNQLLEPGFDRHVAQALDEVGLPAEALEIEITESIAMQSPETMLPRLAALKALGVGIAIDDFGTGYSSLSRLGKLAADRLKIDRSFIQNLDAEDGDDGIAGMIIELARRFGLKVIAEGVETARQRERLLAMGCDELQGYLFSAPLAIEAIEPWLARPPGPPA